MNFFILQDPYLSSQNNKQYSCFSVSEIINTAIIPGKLCHMLNTHRSHATCNSNVNREPSFFQYLLQLSLIILKLNLTLLGTCLYLVVYKYNYTQ